MDINFVQIILVFIVAFIAAIDQFNLSESLYQPLVTGAVIGLILGDLKTGLAVGATYQLMVIGNMPIGGAQPPNSVIGGIMAAIFAITSKFDVNAAVGLAIPFSIIGQYVVKLLFTAMSPMMAVADKMAKRADTKGIIFIQYIAMSILGFTFAIICVIGLIGGTAMGTALNTLADNVSWLMNGLGAAGSMMRFVGFAILLRIMLSKALWGFYFAGFALAVIIGQISELSGSAIILCTFIGVAIAIYDFQIQCAVKKTASEERGDEDGI